MMLYQPFRLKKSSCMSAEGSTPIWLPSSTPRTWSKPLQALKALAAAARFASELGQCRLT